MAQHRRYERRHKLADLVVVGATVFLIALSLYTFYGKNPHEITNNPYSFQIVLTDENNSALKFNIYVSMEAQNLSADLPITVNADAVRIKNPESEQFIIYDHMYLIFVGSNQIPPAYTELAYGQYFGQIVLTKEANSIHYIGNGTIKYPQGGSFPMFISSVGTSIAEPLDESEVQALDLPIGSIDDTRALESFENERINLGLTFAIIGLSVAALRPVAQEVADDLF